MKLLNFESQNLMVDWISFNIQGLPDPGTIAHGLCVMCSSMVPFAI